MKRFAGAIIAALLTLCAAPALAQTRCLQIGPGGAVTPTTTPCGTGGGGGGTVTSVGATSSDGSLAVSGSPVTTSGAIDLTVNASNITTGVLGASHGGAGTVSGILKANGAGVVSAAASGTDYAPATTGTGLLYPNGSGGFSNATIGAGLGFSGGALVNTVAAPSAANPTATASDTAVNGSAATFMRSDAAPAVQKASASQFGIVEVDGTTITASGGVISAVGGGGGGGSLTQLAQVTTTAGQTSVTVMTSIPGTYKALLLEVYGGSAASTTNSSDQLGLQFNGDTTSGHYLSTGFGNYNTGTFNIVPVASTSMQVGILPMTGASGVHAGYNRVSIPSYTATAFRIHGIYNSSVEQNNVGKMNGQGSGEWAPTSLAAITSIVALNMNGNAFMTGTVITLYGQN